MNAWSTLHDTLTSWVQQAYTQVIHKLKSGLITLNDNIEFSCAVALVMESIKVDLSPNPTHRYERHGWFSTLASLRVNQAIQKLINNAKPEESSTTSPILAKYPNPSTELCRVLVAECINMPYAMAFQHNHTDHLFAKYSDPCFPFEIRGTDGFLNVFPKELASM